MVEMLAYGSNPAYREPLPPSLEIANRGNTFASLGSGVRIRYRRKQDHSEQQVESGYHLAFFVQREPSTCSATCTCAAVSVVVTKDANSTFP